MTDLQTRLEGVILEHNKLQSRIDQGRKELATMEQQLIEYRGQYKLLEAMVKEESADDE